MILNYLVYYVNIFFFQPAHATPDPLVQHLAKKAIENTFQSTSIEIDKLPIEERIAKSATPFAHLPYDEQLSMKQEMAFNVLKKLGREVSRLNPGLQDFIRWQKLRRKGSICELDPIIPSPVVDGYRNKCEFTVGVNSDSGAPTIGFRVSSYKEGNISVGPIDDLKHISDKMKKVVKSVEEYIRSTLYDPFNPMTHDGVWRQVTLRTSSNGDCMVIVHVHPQQLEPGDIQAIKDGLIDYCSTNGEEAGVTSLYCVVSGQRLVQLDYCIFRGCLFEVDVPKPQVPMTPDVGQIIPTSFSVKTSAALSSTRLELLWYFREFTIDPPQQIPCPTFTLHNIEQQVRPMAFLRFIGFVEPLSVKHFGMFHQTGPGRKTRTRRLYFAKWIVSNVNKVKKVVCHIQYCHICNLG